MAGMLICDAAVVEAVVEAVCPGNDLDARPSLTLNTHDQQEAEVVRLTAVEASSNRLLGLVREAEAGRAAAEGHAAVLKTEHKYLTRELQRSTDRVQQLEGESAAREAKVCSTAASGLALGWSVLDYG